MLILSLMVSVSALAFELTFDGSAEREDGAIAVVTPSNTGSAIHTGAANTASPIITTHIHTAIGTSPSFTDPNAPTHTEKPENTEDPDYTYPPYTNTPDNDLTEDNNGDVKDTGNAGGKDEISKPGDISPVTLEGETDLYGGRDFWFSVCINDPIAVKAGAISINFDSEIFDLVSIGWSLSEDPVIFSVNDEQKNGVFAYASPTYIQGEIFSFSVYLSEGVDYGDATISVDVILKDENQEDIQIEDPSLPVYVGCNDHYFCDYVEDRALANEATCSSYAEYYLTCHTCRKLSSDTFTYYDGGYADHSVRDIWHADEESHWHGCDFCHNVDTDIDKHSFGKWVTVKEPTKDEEGIRECSCEVCGYTKTEPVKYKTSDNTDSDDDVVEVVTTAAQGGNTVINISGCGASVSLGALAVLPVLASAVLIKRKED